MIHVTQRGCHVHVGLHYMTGRVFRDPEPLRRRLFSRLDEPECMHTCTFISFAGSSASV